METPQLKKIAALFVEGKGPYSTLPEVDAWDIVKDARSYAGPYPVVAHPPCQRWGRYATGGPNPNAKRCIVGDDGGCFESALKSVREFGGVLEHPEATHAYARYGIARPPRSGGWIKADELGGYTCCVEQGHYGHKARKATWLYAIKTARPELKWGPSEGLRIDEGFRTKEEATLERKRRKELGIKAAKRPTFKDRVHTPDAFRDLLISIAQSVYES